MYYYFDEDGNLTSYSEFYFGGKCTTIKPKPFRKANFVNDKWEYEKKEKMPILEKEKPPMTFENLNGIQYYYLLLQPEYGDKRLPKEENITVLIPCYNQSQYLLTHSVKSALEQTLKPYQIIVLLMDNDSYKLKDKLEELGCICYKEKQMNVVKARQYLIDKCETNYFCLLDADDMLASNFLEVLYKLPQSICFACNDTVDINKNMISKVSNMDKNYELYGHPYQSIYGNLTGLIHKEIWNDLGGCNEKYTKGGEDYDFMLRLFEQKKWDIGFTSKTRYLYTLNPNGATASIDFIKSRFECMLNHIDYLHNEYVAMFGDDEEEQYLYSHQSIEEWFNVLVVDKYKDIDDVLKIKINNMLIDSFDREPIADKELVYVNCNEIGLEHYSFDACFLSDVTGKKVAYIVKKSLKDKSIAELIKNYCCVYNNIVNIEYEPNYDIYKELLGEEAEINKFKKAKNVVITWRFGRECNLKCPYCNLLSDINNKDNKMSEEEMYKNFDEMVTWIEQNIPYKVNHKIIGGEPTLMSYDLQNKILDRLKDYRCIAVFSNGADKESPLWKSKRTFIFYHITDFEKNPEHALKKNLGERETSIVVVTHKNLHQLREFANKHYIGNIGLAPCYLSPTKDYDLNEKEIKEVYSYYNECGHYASSFCEYSKGFQVDVQYPWKIQYCCASYKWHDMKETLANPFGLKVGCEGCTFWELENNRDIYVGENN